MVCAVNVDGTRHTVEEGTNLLVFLKSAGKDIPSLCFHPRLSETGACRLCIVRTNKYGITTSCTLKTEEGLEIITEDEELSTLRKSVFELLVNSLNPDCENCPKDGECELQRISKQLGMPLRKTSESLPVDNSPPPFIYNPNRCIRCFRCIKACDEIQGKGILSFSSRGKNMLITTGYSSWNKSRCDGCGECIQMCPTSALMEKEISAHKISETETKKTTCPYCGVGCQINVNLKNNKIVRVTGSEESPNNGSLCVKGRFGLDGLTREERLTSPLVRKNGELEKISWEEALNLIAEKLAYIKKKYSPDSICGLSSAKCTNEENYIFQKFMRVTIGTNNIDHCARLCHASTITGLVHAFGSGAMTNSIWEIEHAGAILVTGSNTTEAHPVIATFIKRAVKNHGAKLIVVDPREIDLTRYATLHLQQKNGTDVAWLNGMMHVIISEKLYDKRFVESRTENFEELKKVVMEYTPGLVESITGIPKDTIIEAARVFATAKSASIVYSMGITQHTTGTDNVLSIANLAMLTGNVGKLYSGVNPLRGQNNVQGACDMGALPNVYPGYQNVDKPEIRKKFERAWKAKLPNKPGLTVVEMFNGVLEGSVKAMYIMGENPAMSDPNLSHMREALKQIEFLVVQDIYLSETCEYAHVVLPAASPLEKEGTFTNTERRILPVHKVTNPPSGTLEDWKIICTLSEKMGYPMEYSSESEIMKEASSLIPIYSGFSYDRIHSKPQWPITSKEHPGTPFLHEKSFPQGKGLFSPADYVSPAEQPDKNYPFILSTGRILFHYHTGTISRRSKFLTAYTNEPYVEINPQNAKELSVSNSETVKVSTPRGSIVLKAIYSSRVLPGCIFIPFHFREAAANLLTNDALDPLAKIPEFKVAKAKCRVEKL